jgi:hypothetical protein
MPDVALSKEPALRAEPERAPPREGIVVSTVTRLTTSDGRTFEDTEKAVEHEAFYQILKRLVKDLGWPDNEATGSFALNLAKSYRTLLPVLAQLEKDAETLHEHLTEYGRGK